MVEFQKIKIEVNNSNSRWGDGRSDEFMGYGGAPILSTGREFSSFTEGSPVTPPWKAVKLYILMEQIRNSKFRKISCCSSFCQFM